MINIKNRLNNILFDTNNIGKILFCIDYILKTEGKNILLHINYFLFDIGITNFLVIENINSTNKNKYLYYKKININEVN